MIRELTVLNLYFLVLINHIWSEKPYPPAPQPSSTFPISANPPLCFSAFDERRWEINHLLDAAGNFRKWIYFQGWHIYDACLSLLFFQLTCTRAQNHRGTAHPRERLISVLWGDLFVRSASIASQACSLTHQHTFVAPGSIPTVASYHAFFLFCAHAAAACVTLTLFYL